MLVKVKMRYIHKWKMTMITTTKIQTFRKGFLQLRVAYKKFYQFLYSFFFSVFMAAALIWWQTANWLWNLNLERWELLFHENKIALSKIIPSHCIVWHCLTFPIYSMIDEIWIWLLTICTIWPIFFWIRKLIFISILFNELFSNIKYLWLKVS